MKSQSHCEIERKSRAGGPWWFIYVMTFKHNSAFNIIAIFRTVASKLHITCQNCKWMHLFWTWQNENKRVLEVNRRLVYGMRRIGKGHHLDQSLSRSHLVSLLSMQRQLLRRAWKQLQKSVCFAAKWRCRWDKICKLWYFDHVTVSGNEGDIRHETGVLWLCR
jgi:hypothetical protein